MDFLRSLLSFVLSNLHIPAIILLSISTVMLSMESSNQKKEINKLIKKVARLESKT